MTSPPSFKVGDKVKVLDSNPYSYLTAGNIYDVDNCDNVNSIRLCYGDMFAGYVESMHLAPAEYVPVAGDVVECHGVDSRKGLVFKGIVFVDEDGDLMLASNKNSTSLERRWDYLEKYVGKFPMTKIGHTDILSDEPHVDIAVAIATAYFAAKSKPEFVGTYEERQAQWVEHYGIKVGSKVKVIRIPDAEKDGWSHKWQKASDSECLVGKVCSVGYIHPAVGFSMHGLGDAQDLPYYCLEPVE